jgi:hypothetical protein
MERTATDEVGAVAHEDHPMYFRQPLHGDLFFEAFDYAVRDACYLAAPSVNAGPTSGVTSGVDAYFDSSTSNTNRPGSTRTPLKCR